MKYLILSETTNNRNENVINDYLITEDDLEMYSWKADKEKQIRKWNYDTPGPVSRRNITFTEYNEDQFKDISLSDISHLKLVDLTKLLIR